MSTFVSLELNNDMLDSRIVDMGKSQSVTTFTAVYNEYKHRIYSYILYRVDRDQDLAEDIVSDIFLKAYEKFDTYDQSYAISTWLYTIARNTLIDNYRRRKETIDIEFISLADETDPLYRLLTEDISLREVDDAIKNLSPEQRSCIEAQFFKGQTSLEIANATGLSHAAVRKHVSRGIANLRTALLAVCLVIYVTALYSISL
jgi:RNA polymerase sigma-70 factor, ECF subfamily